MYNTSTENKIGHFGNPTSNLGRPNKELLFLIKVMFPFIRVLHKQASDVFLLLEVS